MARPRKQLPTPLEAGTELNPDNLPVVVQVWFHAAPESMGGKRMTLITGQDYLVLEDTADILCISKKLRRKIKVAKAQCKSWEIEWKVNAPISSTPTQPSEVR